MERDLRTPAFETYLHRIGRSGRFGRKGAAFNLVTGDSVSPLPLLYPCPLQAARCRGTSAAPWGLWHSGTSWANTDTPPVQRAFPTFCFTVADCS